MALATLGLLILRSASITGASSSRRVSGVHDGGREARPRPTSGNVDARAHHGGPDAVTRRGHGLLGDPAIARGLVHLRGPEDPQRGLAAEHVDPIAEHGCGDPATT